MNSDLAPTPVAPPGPALIPGSVSSVPGLVRKRLSRRARGLICLSKARKAVRETCGGLRPDVREELVSAILPSLWRRVRNWLPREKRFSEFAEQSAFQSLKDCLRRIHASKDALDRMAVALGEFGDGV